MSVTRRGKASRIPALETGDHLSAREFERRYDAMPALKKAELIDGVVYVPSPTRWNHHAVKHQATATWLGTYWAHTPGVQAGESGTLRLDPKNEPQPDLALIVLPSHGGQVKIDKDHYIAGAPELVAEISASTVSIDLHAKFKLYLRKHVREYIVWRVDDETIDWFVEQQGRFERLEPDAAGIFKSTVFPGLWLDAEALIKLDLLRVLHVLEQGIASPEHAAFIARLNAVATRKNGG
jgi:Putative restriction endonuclease